jgi:hypothetical protein
MGANLASSQTAQDLVTSDWGQTLSELYAEYGKLLALAPLGNGHIHNTFEATWQTAHGQSRVAHQRVNSAIFGRPEVVIDSITRATESVGGYFRDIGCTDQVIELLSLPSSSNKPGCEQLQVDQSDNYWRAFSLIPNSSCFDQLATEDQAFEAGACFGRFQAGLCSLSVDEFPEVIENFHNVPSRIQQLEMALSGASNERVATASELLGTVKSLCEPASRIALELQSGSIPLRVVHNDPKINNVLFDAEGKRAIAVLDLDLIQPGSPLYDYGDLVRSAGVPTAEDEQNLALVKPSKQYMIALKAGYEGALKHLLTDAERALFDTAPMTLAYELGIRFLADFLNGDKYFRVKRPLHNLERARTQLHLAMEFYKQL